MSTFCGQMKEYLFVSMDKFDRNNLNAEIYFLSHCHEDHMHGLQKDVFYDRLYQNNLNLYCSEVTKALLLMDKRFARLKPFIKHLPMESTQTIEAPLSHSLVNVTLIPAAHCPGSAMFLFEGSEGTVLYTGDFRLQKNCSERIKILHDSEKKKKSIKSIYIDTTFCLPGAYYIPNREDCLKELLMIIRKWIRQGNHYKVRLNLSAKYGYECLFHDLYKAFQMKVFCGHRFKYKRLPETLQILTKEQNSTQIHAFLKQNCKYKHLWKPDVNEVGDIENKTKWLNVTLSTMYFTSVAQPEELCRKVGENHYRLCFAFHSSFSEVCDFLQYFSPQNVYANVLPSGDKSHKVVEDRIKKACSFNLRKNTQYKNIGTLQQSNSALIKRSSKFGRDISDVDDDEIDAWNGLLRKKKSRKNDTTMQN